MGRITGLISRYGQAKSEHLLQPMLKAISLHSHWKNKKKSMGEAFFATADWSSPVIFSSQEKMILFDGSIYNKQELSMRQACHSAELFFHLFNQVGFISAVQKINGDFSIALFDAKQNELWLARDRLGVKPLYFTKAAPYFAFASQPRSLLILPETSEEVNLQFAALFAASHYRYFDNQAEYSPYRDIQQLPAAHILHYKDGTPSVKRYWSLQEQSDFEGSETVLASEYRELLKEAVMCRYGESFKPAFTLSGGLDSSSVLAFAAHCSQQKQIAISTIYDDKTYDESDEIHSMLEATVKEWIPVKVDLTDPFVLIERMINIHDEPVATATWASHFLLCEETHRRGIGSLFGGLGGDELNAGEYEHFLFFFADLKRRENSGKLKEEIQKWALYHNHPIYEKNEQVALSAIHRLTDLLQPGKCLADRNRLERYSKALNADFFRLIDFQPIMDHLFTSYLKNRTYQDLFRETMPCCLRAEDRNTSFFELDHHLPFLDYRLVEFMFRIPGEDKIRHGVTKHLLREAMKGILPEPTRTRIKKVGWNAPAHLWFSGPNREFLLDLVHSQNFRARGIYNTKEVLRIIDEHEEIVQSQKKQENHMMFLWQMVNLELWFSSINKTSTLCVS